MKKIFSFMLALALVLAMGTTAFAGTITVNKAVENQTYTAYKIFDVTTAGTNTYAYTISNSSEWYSVISTYTGIELTETTTSGLFNVKEAEGFDAADFAKTLNEYIAGKTPAGSGTTSGTSATINVADAGYYFIDSSLGSLCMLNTAAANVTVEEKNTTPNVDKKEDKTTLSIGEVVTYTVEVTVGTGTSADYVLTDTMAEALTYNKDLAVKVGDTDVAEHTDLTNETEQGFVLTIDDEYLKTLAVGTKITLTYSATLNEQAEANTAYKNTVVLTYNNITDSSEVEVKTFQFVLNKVDANKNPLTGAEFKLYDAATGGNEIKVVADGANAYRVAKSGETGVVITAGNVTVNGLGNGTYYLEETKAPAGYNQLTERVKVTIDNANAGDVEVTNLTGAQLPSTGGMGTTIFYIAGAVLMIGAAVLLITKKRMSAEK